MTIQIITAAEALTMTGHPGTEYVLDRAPYTRFLWNGAQMVVVANGGDTLQANTLAVVGDSFLSRWRVVGAGTIDYRPQGLLTWAQAYSGQRMTVVSDQSVAGAWVSQGGSVTPMITQIDAAIASRAKHLLLMGGYNDIVGSATLATIQAAFVAIIGKARAAGMTIWVALQPCLNSAGAGYSVARQGLFFQMNDWLKTLANSSQAGRGIYVIDTASRVVSPSSATGNYFTNGAQADSIHPSNLAAQAMGKEIARVWSLYVPEVPLLLAADADSVGYSTSSTNILTNGLMLAGSPTATGWTQSVTGTGANTPSIVARADGFGNDQQQLATFAANNDSVVLTSGDLKANVSLGDILTASCELNLSAMSATRCIRVQLAMVGSVSSKTMSWCQLDSSVDLAMTDAPAPIVAKTEPIQYTADMGTLTSVTLAIRAFGTGAGGVTLKIGRAAVRKFVPFAVDALR